MTVFRAEDVQTATRTVAATIRDQLQIGSVDELRELMLGIIHEELPGIFPAPAAPTTPPTAAAGATPGPPPGPTTT